MRKTRPEIFARSFGASAIGIQQYEDRQDKQHFTKQLVPSSVFLCSKHALPCNDFVLVDNTGLAHVCAVCVVDIEPSRLFTLTKAAQTICV
jgi:hypothetical protein